MDKDIEQSSVDTATEADDAATIAAAQDTVDAEIAAEDLASGDN